jgi:hypothetical protein
MIGISSQFLREGKMRNLFLAFVLTTGFVSAMSLDEGNKQLVVSNRIVATVNGKTISALDVKKKMDVFLAHAYPHLMSSVAARHQFYSQQWRAILDQMINTELMLADAELREVKVSDAEVRERLQERFGPNVMGNLEKIQVSLDETRKMMHDEMVVERMTWLRVQSKALNSVGPQDVKKGYEEYKKEHPESHEWKYRVVTVRSPNEQEGSLLADEAHSLLAQAKVGLEEINTAISAASLSPVYETNDKNLSAAYRDILAALPIGGFSKPIPQVSRADKTTVYRIFNLVEKKRQKTPIFSRMASEIQNTLIDKEITREMALYIPRLRHRFGFSETVPADFQPFTLQ